MVVFVVSLVVVAITIFVSPKREAAAQGQKKIYVVMEEMPTKTSSTITILCDPGRGNTIYIGRDVGSLSGFGVTAVHQPDVCK